jgi:hypothetical protein
MDNLPLEQVPVEQRRDVGGGAFARTDGHLVKGLPPRAPIRLLQLYVPSRAIRAPRDALHSGLELDVLVEAEMRGIAIEVLPHLLACQEEALGISRWCKMRLEIREADLG